jgi:hypothetical protein
MPTPYYQLQIRRGLKANLPTLADGELGWCEDTEQLFVGTASDGNQLVNDEYMPAAPSNWNSPAPSSIRAAIDRLAAAVKLLGGNP